MWIRDTGVFLIALSFAKISAEFLQQPESQNITYGDIGVFVCTTDHLDNFDYDWIVNGKIVNDFTLQHEGLVVSEVRISFSVRKITLQINGSFYKYNNASVQCRVADFLSQNATLWIQGPAARLNLTIAERSSEFIILNWKQPERIVLHPHDIDVEFYKINILNIASGRQQNISVDGNITSFHYRASNNGDQCSMLQFCISPIRSAGVEEVEECITTSFKRGIISNGPTYDVGISTTLDHSTYICNITCSENSIVTWTVNGKSLQQLQHASFSTGSNYITACSLHNNSDIDPVYTEHLEIKYIELPLIQLQCVSVFHCRSGLEDCISSVCFSHVTHEIKQVPRAYTSDTPLDSATDKYKNNLGSNEMSYVDYHLGRALLGTATGLGMALILMSSIFILLLIFIFKMKKSKNMGGLHRFAATNPSQNEAIYDLCGGPTLKSECMYDKPKTPSPQPNMQPCEAYSTLPETSTNV